MRVAVPKDSQKLKEFFEWMFYKLVKSDKTTETYKGTFAFRIDFDAFGVPRGKREKFYRAFRVEGGFKTRYKDWFDVTPIRKRRINFLLSEEELELYKQYLQEHKTTLSEHLRLQITEVILGRMRRKQGARAAELKKRLFEQGAEEKMFG